MHQNTVFLPKRSLEEHIWPSEKARRQAWFVHPTKESLRMTKETEKTTDQASLIHPYREVLTPRNMTCTLHTTTPTMRLLFNWWKDHARSIKSFDFWCWGVSAKRWSTSVYGTLTGILSQSKVALADKLFLLAGEDPLLFFPQVITWCPEFLNSGAKRGGRKV